MDEKPVDRLNRVLNALALEVPEGIINHARSEIMTAFQQAVRDKQEACARLAEEPYSDEVKACGPDSPKTVGRKIARAIRALPPGNRS